MQISASSATIAAPLPALAQQRHAAEGAEVRAQDRPLSDRATPETGQTEAAPPGRGNRDAGAAEPGEKAAGDKGGDKDPLNDPNSPESVQLKTLQARDSEVRAHEQAHLAAAGKYATSGPTYSYQNGPDGKQYAIGGEVGIDVAEVAGDPEATIAKMQVVQRAALAPAEPSGQDIRVAAQAAQTASAARAELSRQQLEKMQGGDESADSESSAEPAERRPADSERASRTELEARASYAQAQQLEEPRNRFNALA